jgi:hypothetical protein
MQPPFFLIIPKFRGTRRSVFKIDPEDEDSMLYVGSVQLHALLWTGGVNICILRKTEYVCRMILSFFTVCNTSSFLTRSVQAIFSILLQDHISKLSVYFCHAYVFHRLLWLPNSSNIPHSPFVFDMLSVCK